MCGRFASKTKAPKIAKQFQATLFEDFNPHYNIAPTARIPVVQYDPDKRERVLKRNYWGLIPYWAKNPKIAGYTSNARADSVAEKPSFKRAFHKMRCLIPIDGFFEWDRSVKPSQPYYFSMTDEQPFALAGLWESWKVRWTEDEPKETQKPAIEGKRSKKPSLPKIITWPINLGGKAFHQGDVLESCTIITTDANSLMAKVHDRMPVILDPRNYDAWLDPKIEDTGILKALLKPFPADKMQCWPVNRSVNKVGDDDSPNCVEPIELKK